MCESAAARGAGEACHQSIGDRLGRETRLFEATGLEPGELVAVGRRVVTAKTTQISPPTLREANHLFIADDLGHALDRLPDLLAEHRHVTLASRHQRPDLIQGLSDAWVEAIRGLASVDNMILEADGARHRLLKAPAAHEPVMPSGVTLLLAVASVRVVGLPLREEHVHRLEEVARLTGLAPGDTVGEAAVASVIGSPEGGLKSAPRGGRAWAVLNWVDPQRLDSARRIAGLLDGVAGLEGCVFSWYSRPAIPPRYSVS